MNKFVRQVLVTGSMLICLSPMARLSFAQVVQDDLTTMTSEQRRAYLEEYLRKLSPAPFPADSPASGHSAPLSDKPVPETAPAVTTTPVVTQPAPAPAIASGVQPRRENENRPGFVSMDQQLVCSGKGAVDSLSPWVRLRNEPSPPGDAQWVLRSLVASTGRFGALLKESDSYFLEQRCIQDIQKVARYAQVDFNNGTWTLDFGNGLIAEGGVLVPTQQGFLLDQKGVLMEFRLGSEARMVRLPAGYRLAELQHSDVADSRVVLLLSNGLLKSSLNWNDFKDVFRFRGKAEEVAASDSRHPAILYHLDEGRVWSLDLDAADLKTSIKGFCDSSAWAESRSCGLLNDRQWLMTEDGSQKRPSYFWRLGWVKSQTGFSLWVFDRSRSEMVISESGNGQVRRQILPKAVQGVWWKMDGAKPVIMMDTDR